MTENSKMIVDRMHEIKEINDEGIFISEKIMENDVNKEMIEQASKNINTLIKKLDELKIKG